MLAVPPDPFRQQFVRGDRGGLLRQPVVVQVGEYGPDAMRRDRVVVSRQRSRDPVSGQPPDRLAARLTAVTLLVPVAKRLRHDLGRGVMITVRATLVWPPVPPPGHRAGDVVDATVDAEQVVRVTARLISPKWPVRRRVAAHQEAELRVVRHRFRADGTSRVTLAFPPGSDRLIQRIKDGRVRRGDAYAGIDVQQEHVGVNAAGVAAFGEDGEPGAVIVMHRPDFAGDRSVRAQPEPVGRRRVLPPRERAAGILHRLHGSRPQGGRADGRQAVQQPPRHLPAAALSSRLRLDVIRGGPDEVLEPPLEPQATPRLVQRPVHLGAGQLGGRLLEFPRAGRGHDRVLLVKHSPD